MAGDTIFITSCTKIFHSYYAKTEVGDAAVQHYQKTYIILPAQGKKAKERRVIHLSLGRNYEVQHSQKVT